MTPEAQRIAIAEACGWRPRRSETNSDWHVTVNGEWRSIVIWDGPDGERSTLSPPDYLNDLNAMYGAEKLLMDERSITYKKELERVSCIWHASAAQRAEAFLKTLNLWT